MASIMLKNKKLSILISSSKEQIFKESLQREKAMNGFGT